MRRKNTFLSAGVLFMGAIIVLGAIGIANGLWSKNLVVNGTVTTGDLNADWDCAWTNDDGVVTSSCAGLLNDEPSGITSSDTGLDPGPGDSDFVAAPNFVYHDPFVHKDVAECRVRIHGPTEGEDGAQVADVTINNAYPSYECRIVLTISNTGSIPFNIAGVFPTLGTSTTGLEFLDANGENAGLCLIPTGQVDPPAVVGDGSNERRVECIVHVLETARQSVCSATATTNPVVVTENCAPATLQYYHFALNACVAQWNEGATYEECKRPPVGTHEGPDEVTPPGPHIGPLIP